MKQLATLILILTCCAPVASASDSATLGEKIEAAMAAESRPQADRDRDRNRRPVETLQFFGLRDDMKVIELMPGGGWYTRLLAPTLAENGAFYVALGTGRVSASLMGQPGFENMQVTAEGANMYRPEGSRHYVVEMDGLGVENADMVLTFRNYHNFAAEGRAVLNQAVFDALKPGGIYAVVDHNRRHMEPDNNENRRRVDPVLVIKEVEATGFEFVDYSSLHYRPDDELRYEVGRRTVTGNTDRFTLKFRRPE
jgi:predicted methyltransferase